MDEHKENIQGKDVNVKMSGNREDEKVCISSSLAFCSAHDTLCSFSFTELMTQN